MEHPAELPMDVQDSLRQIRSGSMILVISELLLYTAVVMMYFGFIGSIISAPRYMETSTGPFYLLERMGAEIIVYVVLSILIGIAGLILLLVGALGPLVSGCDGLASWNPSFKTGARLFHLIRTGIVLLIAGVFIFFIGVVSPLAAGILLLIMGILALVLTMVPRTEGSITFISAVPKAFSIYLAIIFLILGILGIVFHQSITAGLIGGIIILMISLIFLGISFVGLAIVFIQIGRIFKSSAMIVAGALLFFPLLSIASLVVASMEIPIIIPHEEQPE